jgi:hypothetical protein
MWCKELKQQIPPLRFAPVGMTHLASELSADPVKQQIPPLRFAPVGMTNLFQKTSETLADEDCAAIDVEDLAGDEAGEGGAEEEDGRGDLVDVGCAAEWDEG